MNYSVIKTNVAIPQMFWDLLQEQYGHITTSKSAQLRLVLHLWAEPILESQVNSTKIDHVLLGAD